jgi:xylulokinase
MTAVSLLGVDLGTSSVKAVITNANGETIGMASRSYAVESANPGWVESDPRDWWRETVTAVREAVAEARSSEVAPPSAVAVSGQMHGVVLADDRLEAVRPAILWADTRASDVMHAYDRLERAAMERLANPVFPGLAGPILLWLSRYESSVLATARWALQPKDWLRARLTGDVLTEPSDASATLLYDVPGERWDTEVIDALGLDRRLFAPLTPWAGVPAGRLTASSAAELGLDPGLPVATGAGDTAAAMFGTGLREPGRVQLTLGTGGQIVSGADEPTRGGPGTTLFRTAARRGWYQMAATTNAGLALDWVRSVLGATWEDLYGAASGRVGDMDPLFLPHLTGERTPWLDPTMRGAWVGLSLVDDRTSMLRASLEGVAFTIRAAMESLAGPEPRPTVRLAGGGSTDPAWRQLIANVLGTTLDAVDVPAASARGAALLAGCAIGVVDEDEVFGRLAPGERRVCDPDASDGELATARYRRWLEHVSAARHVGERRQDRPNDPGSVKGLPQPSSGNPGSPSSG